MGIKESSSAGGLSVYRNSLRQAWGVLRSREDITADLCAVSMLPVMIAWLLK